MSQGSNLGPQSFYPGGAIQQGAAVKLSAANTVVVATAVTETVLGVALEAASGSSTTAPIAVQCLRGSRARVKASTTIAAGALLTPTTAGEALTTTTTGDRVYAQALEAATAADQLIDCILLDYVIPA